MTQTELLPCPFCGSEAEIERQGTARASMIYACTDCGCRMETGETGENHSRWNTRAAKPSEVVVRLDRKLSNYGQAYDGPDTYRAYTYSDQPGNIAAHRLGRVSLDIQPSDNIDRGLALLKSLQEQGFGVFELPPLNHTKEA